MTGSFQQIKCNLSLIIICCLSFIVLFVKQEPMTGVSTTKSQTTFLTQDSKGNKGARIDLQASMPVALKKGEGKLGFVAVDFQVGTNSHARVNMPNDFKITNPGVMERAFQKSLSTGLPVTLLPASTCSCQTNVHLEGLESSYKG